LTGGAGGVKAAKYYGAQATGGAGVSKGGKKQQVQNMKQSDAYDQMITPRNVRSYFLNNYIDGTR
jgi:hypothetical protein